MLMVAGDESKKQEVRLPAHEHACATACHSLTGCLQGKGQHAAGDAQNFIDKNVVQPAKDAASYVSETVTVSSLCLALSQTCLPAVQR